MSEKRLQHRKTVKARHGGAQLEVGCFGCGKQLVMVCMCETCRRCFGAFPRLCRSCGKPIVQANKSGWCATCRPHVSKEKIALLEAAA